ncbi:carbohydrate-binding family 9-like protein [Edaphobacter aggregans]|uniref:carbohydrate-binding family 9-like protein n=1 Tax=Edaphobacter aggregans TaxID=570835 RepID=UPI0012FBC5C7|nr:carbohydrate-binding family 9-like protein [Edaphobacter aggregans]
MRHLHLPLALAALVVVAHAQPSPPPATFTALEAKKDVDLNTDPNSAFWKPAQPVFITGDTMGKPVPPYRTEVRARWTKDNLYLLYISPYNELNLKPDPDTVNETNRLWNWDVAEAFIGSDFQNIRQYKEFELSPQSEWVDLNIDLDKKGDRDAIKWDSGFKVSARIDADKKIWYGVMRIPFTSIDTRPPAPGQTLRIGLFRCAGPTSARLILSWQPTMAMTFHSPEHFGTLVLAAPARRK